MAGQTSPQSREYPALSKIIQGLSSVCAGGSHANADIAIRRPTIMPVAGLCQGRINARFDVAFGLTTNCGKLGNHQIAGPL
jgi:hypothetical protein